MGSHIMDVETDPPPQAKLAPGITIVIVWAGVALAIGIAIDLWLGGNVKKPEVWVAVALPNVDILL
jgi:hypothetical protein